MNEESGDTFVFQAAEQGSISERFTRLEEQIEKGKITDPRVLDTYLQLAPQYYEELGRQESARTGHTDRLAAGAIAEIIAVREGDEAEKIAYCADRAHQAMLIAELNTGLVQNEHTRRQATLQTQKAVNWLRLAAARVEMSLPTGSTNIKSPTPLITPSGSPGR